MQEQINRIKQGMSDGSIPINIGTSQIGAIVQRENPELFEQLKQKAINNNPDMAGAFGGQGLPPNQGGGQGGQPPGLLAGAGGPDGITMIDQSRARGLGVPMQPGANATHSNVGADPEALKMEQMRRANNPTQSESMQRMNSQQPPNGAFGGRPTPQVMQGIPQRDIGQNMPLQMRLQKQFPGQMAVPPTAAHNQNMPPSTFPLTRETVQPREPTNFEQPGIFSRIGSGLQSAGQGMGNYAEKLFNDPNRMAMLQGGLSMMNPNSYYDQQGFGSVFQGLQAGLGQAQSGMKGVMDRRKAVSDRALVDAKATQEGMGGDEGEYRAMVTQFLKLPEGDPRKALLGRRIQQLAPKAESGEFMSKAMEKQSAKYIHEGGATADATQSSLKNYLNILDTTIDSPDGIITGPGTDGKLWLGRFLSENLGMELFGDDSIENTNRYIANMGTMVGEIIKQFGAGTGLSDADREFARMISAQDPSGFSKDAIKGVLALNEMRMRADLLEHNDRVTQLKKTSRGATPAYLTKRIPPMSKNLRNHIKNRMAGKSILGEKGGFGSYNDAGEYTQQKPAGWVDRTENEWDNMVKAQKKASSGGFDGYTIKSVRPTK